MPSYTPRDIDECEAHRDAQAREEPFLEGLRAGRLGLSSSLNPYSPGEIGCAEWLRGWHSGTAQFVAEQIRAHLRARAA